MGLFILYYLWCRFLCFLFWILFFHAISPVKLKNWFVKKDSKFSAICQLLTMLETVNLEKWVPKNLNKNLLQFRYHFGLTPSHCKLTHTIETASWLFLVLNPAYFSTLSLTLMHHFIFKSSGTLKIKKWYSYTKWESDDNT